MISLAPRFCELSIDSRSLAGTLVSYKHSDVPTSNRERGVSSSPRLRSRLRRRRAPSRVSQLGSRLSSPLSPLCLPLSLSSFSSSPPPPSFPPPYFVRKSARALYLDSAPAFFVVRRRSWMIAQLRYPFAIDITTLQYRDAILRHFRTLTPARQGEEREGKA